MILLPPVLEALLDSLHVHVSFCGSLTLYLELSEETHTFICNNSFSYKSFSYRGRLSCWVAVLSVETQKALVNSFIASDRPPRSSKTNVQLVNAVRKPILETVKSFCFFAGKSSLTNKRNFYHCAVKSAEYISNHTNVPLQRRKNVLRFQNGKVLQEALFAIYMLKLYCFSTWML